MVIMSFRVPIQNFVVEFPAGLNDSGDVNECCLRELKVAACLK